MDIWPSRQVQDGKRQLSKFEDKVIRQLIGKLEYKSLADARPLLVNQPIDIFRNRELFDTVIAILPSGAVKAFPTSFTHSTLKAAPLLRAQCGWRSAVAATARCVTPGPIPWVFMHCVSS